MSLYDIDPGSDCPEIVRMIVEIPKNSVNKYEYDGKLGVFRLDRALYSAVHYPGDYGFIPGTVAEDEEPIDVLDIGHSYSADFEVAAHAIRDTVVVYSPWKEHTVALKGIRSKVAPKIILFDFERFQVCVLPRLLVLCAFGSGTALSGSGTLGSPPPIFLP